MGSNNKFNPLNLCRENVKLLDPYTSARDEYVSNGNKMIFLDANENPNETGVNRYPDPLQRSLRTEIAILKNVTENQLLFGNGSDEVLDLLFRAFCESNKDAIITFPPTYGMYGVLAAINSVQVHEIPLTTSFNIDIEGYRKKQYSKAKILFICSPNNPSGNLMDSMHVEEILQTFDGLVVVDEAYIDFTESQSWSNRLLEFPNLVVIQTLSKAYGLAGIRLGMLMASDQIISILQKIKPPYNVNELTQLKALERLAQKERIQKEVREIIVERKRLENALKFMPFVKEIFPSEANFVLVRVDQADQSYAQLLDQGIVVRNRSKQLHCENTLRFTIGTPNENNTLIETLNKL